MDSAGCCQVVVLHSGVQPARLFNRLYKAYRRWRAIRDIGLGVAGTVSALTAYKRPIQNSPNYCFFLIILILFRKYRASAVLYKKHIS